MDYHEQIALVTGSGSGIGFACAHALLRKGSRVVINDRRVDALEEAKRELLEIDPSLESLILTIAADVTDVQAVASMFAQVSSEWGSVTTLVNNAGVSGGRKTLDEITDDDWDSIVTANMRGTYLCTKAALPAMYEKQWGRIVNLSSIVGAIGRFWASAHYAATKGGIIAFSKKIAFEAAPHNVAVNCVAPGVIADTGFTHMIKGELWDRYREMIPARRPGTCEEVGELVAFLCSQHAGYIIGQTILIDGGASA